MTKTTAAKVSFTPGPWRYEAEKDNCPDNDDPVAGSIMAGDDFHIARIWSDGLNPEKDARLIAAAPDLLKALQDIMQAMRNESGSTDPMEPFAYDAEWEQRARAADAALAKATQS